MSRLYSLLLLALLVSPASAKEQELDSIVAVVNDDVVLKSELDTALNKARREFTSNFNRSIPREEILQQRVLESVIIKRLQLGMAQKMRLSIDERSLNDSLLSIAKREGLPGLSGLKNEITKQGLSYADYREDLREQLLIQQLYRRTITPSVSVSEQEVDNYVANLQAQGQLNVEYRLSHLLIEIPQAAKNKQIDTLKNKANKLHTRLLNGEDFSQLAVKESAGKNALKGGDMGWIKSSQLPSLFSPVVPGMKRGDISEIIRSPSGFHIIKLQDIRSSGSQTQDLNALKARLRNDIFQRKFNEQLDQWLRQIRSEAYIEIRL
ncbi:MAG: peptidylprolyl isomerase [Gammaproteobacteria bacterium]|nr:peptidylprolyl isomerase [Gammaproteobacteria bacterium]